MLFLPPTECGVYILPDPLYTLLDGGVATYVGCGDNILMTSTSA